MQSKYWNKCGLYDFKQYFAGTIMMLLVSFCYAQNGVPAVAGAKGLSMGGISTTFQDIHAVWGNPAGLGQLENNGFALYGEQRFSLAEIKQIGAVGAIKSDFGGFGLSLGYYGFEDYNEQQLGLAYGRRLADKFSIGLQLKALSIRIPEYGQQFNLTFAFGIQTEIIKNLIMGLRVHSPVRIDVLEDEYLPTTLNFGMQYNLEKVRLVAEIEKDIDLSARVKAGMDYEPIKGFAIRLGISTNPSVYSGGFGYRLKEKWWLDFAASYHQFLGFTPAFGVAGEF